LESGKVTQPLDSGNQPSILGGGFLNIYFYTKITYYILGIRGGIWFKL